MISGGGTGGGVYPALAVVAVLKGKDAPSGSGQPDTVELLWLGSQGGPEHNLVTREDIPFQPIPSGPLAGVGLRAITSAFKIAWGTIRAFGMVRRFRPDALLITGGWVTIPPALACFLARVPVMILMPDIEPGGAITVLSRIAARVAVVAPESLAHFRPGQAVETGYPIRPELLRTAGSLSSSARNAARKQYGFKGKQPILLVFGGSSGARSINRALVAALPGILADWQVIHITGRTDWDWVHKETKSLPTDLAFRYHPYEYLHSEDMAQALIAADLAVSRAGASILGEFPLFHLPAILVPYPYAWRYQETNADRLVSAGAGIRLDDAQLGEELGLLLKRLASSPDEIKRMADAAGALKRPDAAARIAAELVNLALQQG